MSPKSKRTGHLLPCVVVAGLVVSPALVAGAMRLAAALTPAPGSITFAGNSQHTGLADPESEAAQPIQVIHWSTPIDLAPPSGTIFIHYGSPLVTPANTVVIPIKTGSAGGYRIDARDARDGSLIWSQATDYILPPHNWTPSYSPTLTRSNRLYFPGAGGTVYYRDDADSGSPASIGQLAFYGMPSYLANPSSFDATVFIDTPITPDGAGNVYFGFRTIGIAPLGLRSGIARISAQGDGSWVSAIDASGGDINVTRVPHQAAPALSLDEETLYVALGSSSALRSSYLAALDPATLALKESSPGVKMLVALKDPRNGGLANAFLLDDSSASPMVGPDGDVYFGVMGNPFNGSRGWMLHFSGDLTRTKTPGAFGWDSTASVVPASLVPSYAGASAYLLFVKSNNYAGFDGGDGVNRIAILDPNDTMVEPHASSNGALVMKEVMSIAGPTPDPDATGQFPNAVREWCINSAAVDPLTASVLVNSEDGRLYRWSLATNRLSQAITLSPGVGEAYTPTVLGPDGTAYAINWAILNAVGRRPSIAIDDVSVAEGDGGEVLTAAFTVSLSSASQEAVSVDYAFADGLATAGSDYAAASGSLTFAPGETRRTITAAIAGDAVNEDDETFFVDLSRPANATLARDRGEGTIRNDDPLPALTIDDVSVLEGKRGTVGAVFTVTLAPSSGRTVIVGYATADGTATAGADYLPISGSLAFAPGETVKSIPVVVLSDKVKEPDEAFSVVLSGADHAVLSRPEGRCLVVTDDRKRGRHLGWANRTPVD